MKIWVKRSSDSEEEALKVTLDELSYVVLPPTPHSPPPSCCNFLVPLNTPYRDTSDLIQEAVKLFAFGPDNNIALKASQISVHSEDGMCPLITLQDQTNNTLQATNSPTAKSFIHYTAL